MRCNKKNLLYSIILLFYPYAESHGGKLKALSLPGASSTMLACDEKPKDLNEEAFRHRKNWQGWSFCTELGVHFASFPGKNWGKIGVDERYKQFWGQFGLLGSPYGVSYTRIFAKKWVWSIKAIWTIFFPDTRWTEEGTQDITLSFIPIIGKYLKAGKLNPALAMFIVPMVYFDLGYITANNICFSLGSVYLWGLTPAVKFPLYKKLYMEVRGTVFLDKVLGWFGFHNFLFSLGLSYKF